MNATAEQDLIGNHAASEALGLWEPQRALTLEAAQRHSKRIRMLRTILIGLAIGLVGMIIGEFITQPKGLKLEDNPAESVRMVNPRYSGRTNDGLPYYLTAAEAIREASRSTEVNLTDPLLEFYRSSDAKASEVTSAHGIFDDTKNTLILNENVDLKTDDGYTCQTVTAQIYTREKRLNGDKPISCQGSFGDVNGNNFAITEAYTLFTFDGGMNAKIKSNTTQTDVRAVTEDTETDLTQTQGSFGFAGDDPIDITARKAIYQAALTTLSEDVVVVQNNATIKSNDMEIFRAEAKDTDSGSLKLGEVIKIDAKGAFSYQTPDRKVTGNRGVYERAKNTITVTGNVVLTETSGNKVTGNKLVYNTLTKDVDFGDRCTGKNCDRVDIRLGPNP